MHNIHYVVVHTILTPISAKQALYRGYWGIGDMYPTLGALGLEDPGIHSVKNDYKSKVHRKLQANLQVYICTFSTEHMKGIDLEWLRVKSFVLRQVHS